MTHMLTKRSPLLVIFVVMFSPATWCIAQSTDVEGDLVEIARVQLSGPYMTEPLPCFDPWNAGDDNRVVVVPDWARAEGLHPADILISIGGRQTVYGQPHSWLQAMRALPKGADRFDVTVRRAGEDVRLRLSCRSHTSYFEAERRVWTAITRRDWNECASASRSAMQTFGKSTSAMIDIQVRCARAGKWSTNRLAPLVYEYCVALLDELSAVVPTEQPSTRKEVLDSVTWLEKNGAAASASGLRDRLARFPLAFPDQERPPFRTTLTGR